MLVKFDAFYAASKEKNGSPLRSSPHFFICAKPALFLFAMHPAFSRKMDKLVAAYPLNEHHKSYKIG